MRLLPELADGFVDLVLGSACVGCATPGRPLCDHCRAGLPRDACVRWPTPTPPGLLPPYATGEYDAVLRAAILAHKERRVLALARPLGDLLATAVGAAVGAAVDDRASDLPTVLVPVPSRPAVVRQRGHDPMLVVTRRAARGLAAAGRHTLVARLLRLRPGVEDQSGLDAGQRAANLAGSMAVRSTALQRLAGRHPRAHVIVCDDVLTTGATLREAQRALEASGVPVLAAATIAATRRKGQAPNFG